jgi:competence protein ComEA
MAPSAWIARNNGASIFDSMHITDRQAEGVAALAVIAAIFYVCDFLIPPFSLSPPNVPFSNSEKGANAVALTVDGNEEGIFFLPPETKVSDLLAAAGIDPQKYENEIGARAMKAGDNVQISGDSRYYAGKMKAVQALALDLPLDLNHLSLSELDLVPGVGEKTAAHIIALRDRKGAYHEIEELMEVEGIKEKKLATLKKYFCIEDHR